MNPVLIGASTEALKKININKIVATLGILLMVLISVVVIKRYKKKNSKEVSDKAFLAQVESSLSISNLSHDITWYEAQAISLATALDAPLGGNGGWLGCDQQSVYDIIKQLKTKDDVLQMELSFGTRELNASWIKKKKSMTLREAISQLMTTGEKKKVNKILADNGIDYSF